MRRAISLSLKAILVTAFAGWCGSNEASAQPPKKNVPERFHKLPDGWTIKSSGIVPEHKIAGTTVRLTVTVLVHDRQELKVTTVECKSDEDAAKVHAILLPERRNILALCPRDGTTIVQFTCNDLKLIEPAYRHFGFTRPKQVWEVSFQAAPLEKCDHTLWNPMCSAFFAVKQDETSIRKMAQRFTFGDRIRVRNCGQGSEKSTFTFAAKPRATQVDADGDITTYAFEGLPKKLNLPQLGVAISVTSECFATTPTKRKAGKELVNANEFWPSDDPDVLALAKKITEGKVGEREKAAAILDWFTSKQHVKYGGPMGTRVGVKKFLQQCEGRCWDFSDCFITLCRAAGLPSRQVLGWLAGEQGGGHLWAEVLFEGEGWQPFDPTSRLGCDQSYVPYAASEDGRAPFVYLSRILIKPKQ